MQPATRPRGRDHDVGWARSRKVTPGRQRRRDGTVVETDIHSPTASPWHADGVQVLSRTWTKATLVRKHWCA
jgi:hypothetical protein